MARITKQVFHAKDGESDDVLLQMFRYLVSVSEHSSRYLATASGIDRHQFSRFFNGHRVPSFEEVIALASVVGVTVHITTKARRYRYVLAPRTAAHEPV